MKKAERKLGTIRRLGFLLAVLVLASIAFLAVFVSYKRHKSSASVSFNECQKGDLSKRALCFERSINTVFEAGGMDAAFTAVEAFYKKDPEFAAACHGYTHQIGVLAYNLFSQGRETKLTNKTADCGYGFYHGFVQKLVQSGGAVEKAGNFCRNATKDLANVLADACWHGLGHGVTAVDDGVRLSSSQKMIEPALILCQKATEGGDLPKDYDRCLSGLFMEVGSSFPNKIPIDKSDPLAVCREQATNNRAVCYAQMYGAVALAVDHDLAAGLNVISAEDDVWARDLITDFVPIEIDVHTDNFSAVVASCRGLRSSLIDACIKGIPLAIFLNGVPEQQWQQAVSVCKADYLNDRERQLCWQFVVDYYKNQLQDKSKLKNVCSMVGNVYCKGL